MTSAVGIRIGALHGQSGVNIETIRYEARTGGPPTTPRGGGGYPDVL